MLTSNTAAGNSIVFGYNGYEAVGNCSSVAEYDGSGTLLRRFVYGPGIDEPMCMVDVADANETYFYPFDGLGTEGEDGAKMVTRHQSTERDIVIRWGHCLYH